MKAKFKLTFNVLGNSRFPTDMLRHDDCMIADYSSVAEVMDTTDHYKITENRNSGAFFKVRIVKYHNGPTGPAQHITHDRWQSFGWVVERDSIHTEVLRGR
jgi:hypothetical protein